MEEQLFLWNNNTFIIYDITYPFRFLVCSELIQKNNITKNTYHPQAIPESIEDSMLIQPHDFQRAFRMTITRGNIYLEKFEQCNASATNF